MAIGRSSPGEGSIVGEGVGVGDELVGAVLESSPIVLVLR